MKNVFAKSGVKKITISAKIIRANGTEENLGIISYWHRSVFKRLLWYCKNNMHLAIPALLIGLLAHHVIGAALATLLVSAGMAITTNRINGAGTAPFYIGWGTGAGTTAVTDTTLFTEDTTSGYARVLGTFSQVTTTYTNDTVQVIGTLIAKAAETITNAGLFDAVTAGNMYMKGDFAGYALAINDGIQFTMQVQYQ